ncbi:MULTISPECIES: cysteine-rich CWC family protein [Vibrio]|uniref:Cysteine-rich CWC family protein n=1 Tax=Vibrio ostreae TaxID=2841925 RepID=A0A975YM28_9VIBR|nr:MULTISPECIES: cysteine-rich CWC family protein [Vibrio]QXO16036.1 cysteine-rich CWC family protein [Vibrio ostreae]
MKTPCIAACKNNGGICSGCHRTMPEIIQWRKWSDAERDAVMQQLSRESATHDCPACGDAAHCDISAGKSTCWCFELETRESNQERKQQACLCRHCLSALPIA